MNKTLSRIYAWMAVCLVTLLLLAGIVWGMWELMLLVPSNVARLWALLATIGMPFTWWFSWYLGHTEVRGLLNGFDKAVDKMGGAIAKSAGLVNTKQTMVIPQVMEQPTIQIIPARTLPQDQLIEM